MYPVSEREFISVHTGLFCHELTGKAFLCLLTPNLVFYGAVCLRRWIGQCSGGVGWCCGWVVSGGPVQLSGRIQLWLMGEFWAGCCLHRVRQLEQHWGAALGTGCCVLWLITTSELPVDFSDLVPVKQAASRALCSQFISALRHKQISM